MSKNRLAYAALATLLVIACAHVYFASDCTGSEGCLQGPLTRADHSIAIDADDAVDFSSVELNLARLKFDAHAQLRLDPRAESLLSSASSSLSSELSPAQWQQVEILIMKSFPARHSSILFSALQRFHAYFQALQNQMSRVHNDGENGGEEDSLAAIEEEAAQQALREDVQRRYLGDDFASGLYAKQNTLARYLLELRLIDVDPAIKPDDKVRRSAQIEQALQKLMSDTHE